MNFDCNNYSYIDGLSTFYLQYVKPGTPFAIKYYCQNTNCKDYIIYYGIFDKINTLSGSGLNQILSLTDYSTKLSYINDVMSKNNSKDTIYLSNYNFYLVHYDIYTGKYAEDIIKKYTNNTI